MDQGCGIGFFVRSCRTVSEHLGPLLNDADPTVEDYLCFLWTSAQVRACFRGGLADSFNMATGCLIYVNRCPKKGWTRSGLDT